MAIDIDTSISVDEFGVQYYTYVGNEHDGFPSIEDTISWERLIDELIEAETVPDTGAIVVDYGAYGPPCDGVEELMNMAAVLRDAACLLEERVRQSQIFIRGRWAEDGYSEDIDDYCVSYNDYLTYVVENN